MWIRKKHFEQLKAEIKKLNEELVRIAEKPQLLDVEREGMKLVFTIYNEGKVYRIETVPVVTGGRAVVN